MKLARYRGYQNDGTELSEAALLTIWSKLTDFHEHLALVGGLVPRYLCSPQRSGWKPHTLDVDLAIALAADGGMYEPLSYRLMSEGFEQKSGRFQKQCGVLTMYLDFLTERPSPTSATTLCVDDIPVTAFFGIDRALANYRIVPIEGRDLSGAKVREQVKVCEIGPFLCLKLQAYGHRSERKDVFDVVHALLAYDQGVEAAVAGFNAEAEINIAFNLAKKVLEDRFMSHESKGPRDYSLFCLQGEESSIGTGYEEMEFRRATLAIDAQRVAKLLLRSE
jgi:hypothetical protein